MIEKLTNWFRERFGGGESAEPRVPQKAGARIRPRPLPPKKKVPRRNPEFVDAGEDLSGTIVSNGPGKNVLIRNKYVREDTGTHEKLKILDDSLVDSGEEPGEDPYNTGRFDRSRNWEHRFRK
ncbi:MAG: hypothetical protein MJA32_06475 [Proteobacteria bacterium]|nr:hypothetical protein [Pseudomonadota bacterium]